MATWRTSGGAFFQGRSTITLVRGVRICGQSVRSAECLLIRFGNKKRKRPIISSS